MSDAVMFRSFRITGRVANRMFCDLVEEERSMILIVNRLQMQIWLRFLVSEWSHVIHDKNDHDDQPVTLFISFISSGADIKICNTVSDAGSVRYI